MPQREHSILSRIGQGDFDEQLACHERADAGKDLLNPKEGNGEQNCLPERRRFLETPLAGPCAGAFGEMRELPGMPGAEQHFVPGAGP